MWVSTEAFHAPKRGHSASEYEDAFFPKRASRRDLAEFRCAVADGASESAFSGEWARLLVGAFSRGTVRLHRLKRCWERFVKRRPVPWYLEAKINQGSHAALVGLAIADARAAAGTEYANEPGGFWRAVAVGDSCVFHVRDNELVAFGPIGKAAEFDNNPHLISTDAASQFGVNEKQLKVFSGRWKPKDSFFLATDALAHWVLAEHEAGRAPWPRLHELHRDTEHEPFDALVEELRSTSALRNDDTTLLRVEVI